MANKTEDKKEEAVNKEIAQAVNGNVEGLADIADYNDLKQAVERLTSENTAVLADNSKLKEVNGEYIKTIEGKDLDMQEALKLIQEQQAALSAQDNASEATIITIDKKKYTVAVPVFSVKGVSYKAEDLKSNKELAEWLVKSKSSILSLVK